MAGYGRRKGNGVGQGPAGGDGWGGPAKGASSAKSRKAPAFNAETTIEANERRWNPAPGTVSRAAVRAARTIALEDMLYDLADHAEREETRVSAAVKLHAIYNGSPIARNININSDDVSSLSDDELRSELARTGGTPSEVGEGIEEAGMPQKLSGILH